VLSSLTTYNDICLTQIIALYQTVLYLLSLQLVIDLTRLAASMSTLSLSTTVHCSYSFQGKSHWTRRQTTSI
jgi:hypothetical protein